MIPTTTVGLVVLLATLGPGYLYLRVAEGRQPRTERSGLLEAVELIVTGAVASTAASLVTILVGNWLGIVSVSDLARQPDPYFRAHTSLIIGVGAFVLALAYVIAGAAALVVHRKQAVSVKPANTSWYDAFWENRPTADHLTIVTLELRNGRTVVGVLSSFTVGLEDSREIGLRAPIAVAFGLEQPLARIPDEFMVFREADILAASGRYLPPRPPSRLPTDAPAAA